MRESKKKRPAKNRTEDAEKERERNEVFTDKSEKDRDDAYRITDEDKEALGPRDLSLDGGDDEELKHRTRPVDFAGKDLDVPGREADDKQEEIGSEDEENNHWSLGGDRHEDLEEDKS